MNKIKVIGLIGMAGSGKDSLLSHIVEKYPQLNRIINCTTRPPRENEQNGVNYNFYTPEEYSQLLSQDQLVEATSFNDWFYGTELSALDPDKINIGVFNPTSAEILNIDNRIDFKLFYVNVSDKERLLRQLNRESNPDVDEIIRRFPKDKVDFLDIDINYVNLDNENIEDFTMAPYVLINHLLLSGWLPRGFEQPQDEVS